MMENAFAVGFYGKLPCKGDFLQRRVTQEFVDVWDPWVRQSLSESKRQLQERWLDAYLTSPVWRFVLAEGLCGGGAYAGVLLPSVDRVGRYFPLAIVARWDIEVSALQTACHQEHWFESAAALALEALDAPRLDLDDFDRDVARLAGQIDAEVEHSPCSRGVTPDSEPTGRPAHWYLPLASSRSLPGAVGAIALSELERKLHPLSLWWTDGSNEVSPGMLCVRGLPEPSGYAAMLSGERGESGWTNLDAGDAGPDERARVHGSPLSGSR
jgi:type VI secretion system protein ImpM